MATPISSDVVIGSCPGREPTDIYDETKLEKRSFMYQHKYLDNDILISKTDRVACINRFPKSCEYYKVKENIIRKPDHCVIFKGVRKLNAV